MGFPSCEQMYRGDPGFARHLVGVFCNPVTGVPNAPGGHSNVHATPCGGKGVLVIGYWLLVIGWHTKRIAFCIAFWIPFWIFRSILHSILVCVLDCILYLAVVPLVERVLQPESNTRRADWRYLPGISGTLTSICRPISLMLLVNCGPVRWG